MSPRPIWVPTTSCSARIPARRRFCRAAADHPGRGGQNSPRTERNRARPVPRAHCTLTAISAIKRRGLLAGGVGRLGQRRAPRAGGLRGAKRARELLKELEKRATRPNGPRRLPVGGTKGGQAREPILTASKWVTSRPKCVGSGLNYKLGTWNSCANFEERVQLRHNLLISRYISSKNGRWT